MDAGAAVGRTQRGRQQLDDVVDAHRVVVALALNDVRRLLVLVDVAEVSYIAAQLAVPPQLLVCLRLPRPRAAEWPDDVALSKQAERVLGQRLDALGAVSVGDEHCGARLARRRCLFGRLNLRPPLL